jgi:hypothetical protein
MSTIDQPTAELDALIQRLQASETRLTERLNEVRKNLDAAKTTRSLLRQGETRERDVESTSSVLIRELVGKTQLEAMEYIARKNENRLRISTAKNLLVKAGLMKGNKKNFYNILYTILTRSGRYKRIAPGEYELLPIGAAEPIVMRGPKLRSGAA